MPSPVTCPFSAVAPASLAGGGARERWRGRRPRARPRRVDGTASRIMWPSRLARPSPLSWPELSHGAEKATSKNGANGSPAPPASSLGLVGQEPTGARTGSSTPPTADPQPLHQRLEGDRVVALA